MRKMFDIFKPYLFLIKICIFCLLFISNNALSCSLDENGLFTIGCPEGPNKKTAESECVGTGDCEEACKYYFEGNRAEQFNISGCGIGSSSNCTILSYDDEYGFIGRIEAYHSGSFYPVQISCSNSKKKDEDGYRLFYFYTGNQSISWSCKNTNDDFSDIENVSHTDLIDRMYKSMSDYTYKAYRNKKYNMYTTTTKRCYHNTYDNYDKLNIYSNNNTGLKRLGWGWCESPNRKMASRVHNAIVKYLNHGFIVAPVRIICAMNEKPFISYVNTLRELKGIYGSRKIYCNYGYRPNANDTDCIKNHIECAPGYYSNGRECEVCKNGYYCLGSRRIENSYEPGQCDPSSDNPKCHYKDGIFVLGEEKGVIECPNKTDTNPRGSQKEINGRIEGAKSKEDCYTMTKEGANKDGTYLPKGTIIQETCPKGYYCTGGNFYFDTNKNQGILTCQSGDFFDKQYFDKHKKCRPCSDLCIEVGRKTDDKPDVISEMEAESFSFESKESKVETQKTEEIKTNDTGNNNYYSGECKSSSEIFYGKCDNNSTESSCAEAATSCILKNSYSDSYYIGIMWGDETLDNLKVETDCKFEKKI